MKQTDFTVESDSSPPITVRAYHEESYLKIVTDETAECVYDTVDCRYAYEDGTRMSVIDDVDHFTDWKTDVNFYIKCQDEFGNQPLPNECSMVVRAVDYY